MRLLATKFGGSGQTCLHEGLGLEAAGVTPRRDGKIDVNAHTKRQQRIFYAIGDVIDGPMLAHKADEEGVAVAEMIAGKLVTLITKQY